MNEITALSATNELMANALTSRAINGDASPTLFSDQLSTMLAQSMLQQAIGSFGPGGPSGTSSLMQANLLSGLAQNQGTDNSAALMMCMLLMSSGGNQSAGMMAALSSLASAGSENTLRTTGLRTAAAAYKTVSGTTAGLAQNGEAIPYDAWKPVNPSLTNTAGNRSASNYRAVINQFQVETNGRYKVNKMGNNDTYCNIFVWDVTRAMGAEIPHYIDAQTKQPRSYPDTAGTTCMTANTMADWLATTGSDYGWKRVSAEEAQYYANQGHPAVTVWKNPHGHGHVQVVCPSGDGTYNAQKGVTIAQAGRHLYNYAYISQVYSKNTLDDVAYYVHI